MEKFNYSINSLSKKQKKDVERIKNYYVNQELSDYHKLKSLHHKIRTYHTCLIVFLFFFTISFFGVGLYLAIDTNMLVLGIILTLIGAIIAILDKFIYNYISKLIKAKYQDKILLLADKILEEEKN